MIPFVDLAAQHEEVAEEVQVGLAEVFESTAFVGGPAVGRFETEYAAYVGVRHCVGVANGTDALELALRAVGVRSGGEVVLPANSFIASAEAVSRIGATPVLVDVDESQLLIDPAAVAAVLNDHTQAVLPVHLFGQTAPVEELQNLCQPLGIPIVEDSAQAQGARRFGAPAGSLGAIAGTSFYPGKNLGAAGDAGAVTTDDEALADTVRKLGAHGSAEKYVHDIVGMNSRLDTVQAVYLRAKLHRLEKWNEQRRQVAARYAELLGDVPGLRLPRSAVGNEDVWHLYVVRVEDRDRVLRGLTQAGIGAGIHYPTPIHLTGAYASQASGRFPITEAAAGQILSLPMYPHLRSEQQEHIATTLKRLLATGSGRD